MSKKIGVEINGVFYESLTSASKSLRQILTTIKRRCLSDNWLNYKIIPSQLKNTEKRCSECGDVKLLDEFSKDKSREDGLRHSCKQCCSDYFKAHYLNNKVKINKKSKEWKEANPEYQREYDKKNQVKNRKYANKYRSQKRKKDPAFKLNANIGHAIRKSLKGNKQGRHWEILVGYDLNELKKYLESTIPKGYTWDDYLTGELHLDHRIPIYIFNIISVKSKGFKACWALENLRLLPASENLKKNNLLFC